mmetsp:Transcript_18737/g.41671  ORF Transcript_18737/g.41671 Transcript_18737/m.41671 type:complete len:264 (-) Transcript_18737:2367-3158(-)
MKLSWMWPIVCRNVLSTICICGFWDWFLYFSPWSGKLAPYKFNPRYPTSRQILHDAVVTVQASVCGSVVEILICHLYAAGYVPSIVAISDSPVVTCLWAVTITHWRIPHFWLIHRAMHPWKTDTVPDVGRFLYRHVHSLHHKSHNPTAFSGTNMHPVEASAYYSAALICLPFGVHPAVPLGCIIDCAVGAWLGHDGFQWPGSGDYFHYLHHAHFDCNYGARHVPIDLWFGTFAGTKDEVSRLWGRKPAGLDANETPLHADKAD